MKGPSRLMRRTLRHSSTSVSHTVLLMPAIPALLTRMSILPTALSVASRVFSTAERYDTSTWNALTASPICFAVFSSKGWSWSQIATFAPDATKRSVIARPNPCAPPVTTAQRLLRSILFIEGALDCVMSEHVAAVNDEVDAGGEGGFVARQINCHGRDFFSGAQPAHFLARDEHLLALRADDCGAVEHRRRLDGAGADAVAANALRDEVECYRAGQ